MMMKVQKPSRFGIIRIAGSALVAILMIAGCSPAPAPQPASPTDAPTETEAPTTTPTTEPTATSTPTEAPTETPLPTQTPTPIGASAGWIVYDGDPARDSTFDIFVQALDGSEPINLTNSPFREAQPSISPDGAQIVFQAAPNELPELWIMNRDGGDLRKLVQYEGIVLQASPTWSPDGEWIAFERMAPPRETESDLYIVRPDGSDERQITDNARDDWESAWSPDGTMLVYTSRPAGGSSSGDLYVVDIETGVETQITFTPTQDDRYPSWSPDGTTIVFSMHDGETDALVLIDANGENARVLDVLDGRGCFSPDWSPDGTMILCVSPQPDGIDVFAVNIETLEVINLTNSPDLGKRFADW